MITTHEDKALSAPESLGPAAKAAKAAADALAGYTAGRACPNCATTGRHCRPVSSVSYFCQRDGLLAGADADIVPTPDPQALKVKADPQLRVAETICHAAQQAFEAADTDWKAALAAAEHARTSARRTEPIFDQDSPSGWRTTRAARTLALSVPKLEAAAAERKRVRDARDIDLGIARRDYQRAYNDALRRAGLPQTDSNVAPTDLHSLVGGSW